MLVVKTFRKKFAKHLAKLDPANKNKIDFKLDDNDDYGAFEGELKDLVPHGLGRHVKLDGACWEFDSGCYIEIMLQAPFTKVTGEKVNITAQVKQCFLFIFAGYRRCHLYVNNPTRPGCLSNPFTGLLHRGEFKLGYFHGPGISWRLDGSFDDSIWNYGISEEEQTLMCV